MINDPFQIAKEFAANKFSTNAKGNHFLEVFQILQDEFGVTDHEVLIAGLLHDTMEDTDTTSEKIVSTFSKNIANLVEEVSHPKNYTKDQKAEYYESLKSISPGAKMIKLADFTSHLRKFIGAYTGTSDYPKSKTNGYVLLIKGFLQSCSDSKAKKLVFGLTNELDAHIAKQ